ncbi:MAG: DUF58 domain-containing protein [Rhodospirillales bacterium]
MRTDRLSAGVRTPAGESPPLLRAEALASTLPPLLVAAERVAATVAQGVHGRRRVGQGETFWQFRPYQPGDPTRRIDWRQSAKSQRIYTRQTEWEAAQSVWLWRDGSASMRYRSADRWPTKAERAELLALAIASLLTRGGERFALLGDRRPPSTGRAALRRLAVDIEVGRSAAASSLPAVEPLPRHARMVMVGDFLSPLSEIDGAVGAFAEQGLRGHLVHILDPAEETLPFSGRVLFEGLERERSVPFGRVETIRDGYRTAIAAHVDGLRALARRVGWMVLTHRTDQPPETTLMALFLALSQATGR